MRFNRERHLRFISVHVALFQVLSLCPPAYANPQGGAVAAGSASISSSGSTLRVQQQTDKAIINWQSFSSSAGEAVRFDQPTSGSVILNRVTGNEGSVIDGALSANGKVFLLNPNGVLFGKTATVNTGGLVASSLQMSDRDFLQGRYNLQQDASRPMRAVVNQGSISTAPGGEVALIAPLVNNEGIISAASGRVALAAGTKAVVTLDDQGLVNLGIRESAPGTVVVAKSAVSNVLEQAVNNRHLICAGSVTQNAAGEIELAGAEGLAMNQGRINADAAAGRQGAGSVTVDSSQITLAMPGSQTTARGAASGTGGSVDVLSRGRVGLMGCARVDVSGPDGGGRARIGGPAEGQGCLSRARATFVDRDALVAADATACGNGGQVVIWGTDVARVNGTLTARGGPRGGNGGSIETSGAVIEVSRPPRISAPRGRGGEWLLDPDNIRITAACCANIKTCGTAACRVFTSCNGSCAKIQAATITAALCGSGGGQVTVKTTSSGNISLCTPLSYCGAAASLVLCAAGRICITPGSTITSGNNALNVTLNSAGATSVAAAITTHSGAFTARAGGFSNTAAVTTGGGNICITSTGAANTVCVGALLNAGTGSVTIASGRDILSTVAGTAIQASSATLSAGRGIGHFQKTRDAAGAALCPPDPLPTQKVQVSVTCTLSLTTCVAADVNHKNQGGDGDVFVQNNAASLATLNVTVRNSFDGVIVRTASGTTTFETNVSQLAANACTPFLDTGTTTLATATTLTARNGSYRLGGTIGACLFALNGGSSNITVIAGAGCILQGSAGASIAGSLVLQAGGSVGTGTCPISLQVSQVGGSAGAGAFAATQNAAGGCLTVNAITATGGNVQLATTRGSLTTGRISTSGGAVSLTASCAVSVKGVIQTCGGSFAARGNSFSNTATITTENPGLQSGNVCLTAGCGGMNIGAGIKAPPGGAGTTTTLVSAGPVSEGPFANNVFGSLCSDRLLLKTTGVVDGKFSLRGPNGSKKFASNVQNCLSFVFCGTVRICSVCGVHGINVGPLSQGQGHLGQLSICGVGGEAAASSSASRSWPPSSACARMASPRVGRSSPAVRAWSGRMTSL